MKRNRCSLRSLSVFQPAGLLLALMSFAILQSTGCRSTSRAKLPAKPPESPRVDFTGMTEGWPPQAKGAANVQVIAWEETEGSLTDAREAEIRQAALQDARVRDRLGARFAYISTDEIERPKGRQRDPSEPLATRVTFFSHTNNVAVEVQMRGTRVESVELRQGYQPPEGPEEVKEAVALAQGDERLRGRLEGLEGTALLAWPRRGEAGYSDRVLYVAFSREGEDIPRYVATVSLTSQKVLAAGPTPGGGGR